MVGRSAEETYVLICERYGLEEDFGVWVARRVPPLRRAGAANSDPPGAIEAYHALHATRVQQALVSNSDRLVVEANIATMRLFQPRLVSVTINDVREGKPSPEPYLRAAYLLGLEPAHCVVVEDSPTGACSGLAAGMRVFAWPEDAALVFPPEVTLVVGEIAGALADLGLPVTA